jgi:dipeptidyl aminopeptidase/acylaminoacyl peptidase
MNALKRLATALSLLPCVFAADAADSAPSRRPLVAEDLLRVQDVSDPQVSPNGLWVAYVVSSDDRDADEVRSAIWMVSWDGRQQLALTRAADGTSKPKWSPDGHYLAFMAKAAASDKAQIMLLDHRGGVARQATSVTGEIGEYAWAPDSNRLAIAMRQESEEKSPKPIVIDAMHFKQDEDGYLGTGHERHLYLLDIRAKRLEALSSDPKFNEDLPAWSPDGRQIAFIRTIESGPDQDGEADIDVIDAQPNATARKIARFYVPNKQILGWSPDGTLIAFTQGLEPKFNAYMQDHVFLVPSAGGTPRALAEKLDRAATSFVFAADSAAMMISVEDDDVVYPARVEIATGAVTRVLPPAPFVVSALSRGGGHTALLKAEDHALPEVFALEDGRLRKLSAHNDAFLSELQLGSIEDIRFKSKDGTEVDGLMVKPPLFVAGRKYPTLLWIHGGPNEQVEHALVLDGYQFEPQMFAAKGFVVLLVNYRGGSGRGIDYAKTIFADWGDKEVEDLLAGVDHLVAIGIADKERLAIGGWSYGGLLTDYTIASDRRFKAAICGAGSGNQISTFGTDEYILQYNNELGPPWINTALWLKVSYPFFHADRIHTPTLFLGGDKDFNVPISGGEQMYQALRTLGVPAELVVYPGEHHVFTRPSFVMDLAVREPAWIDRFMPH